MENSNSKKSLILLIIGISALLLLITGATFAYFRNQIDDGTSSDLNVTTGTVDNLTFSLKDIDVTSDKVTDEHNADKENANTEIYISAREDNFGRDGKNLGDGVELTANLLANDHTNEAENKYNLFLVIEENNFEYSSDDKKPEIILNITDPDGNEVTDITGLKRTDGGFDITKRKGSFLIVKDQAIVAKPEKEQTWKVKVTLVNLDINQLKNQEKSLTGKVYITTNSRETYKLPEVTSSSVEKTYNKIDFTPTVIHGSEPTVKYYYGIEKAPEEDIALVSKDDVTFTESEDESYTFKGLDENTKYIIYSYVEDESGFESNVYTTEVTTNIYQIPLINDVTFTSELFAIKANVKAQGRDGRVVTYHYYKDNELVTSIPEAEYTYEGLSDTSEYNLKIVVEDENHVKSTAFEKTVRTKDYVYPAVENVDISENKWNSVTLTTNTKESSMEVTKYEYQVETKDGNVIQEWFEGERVQVISGLDAEQEYNVRIRLTDSMGRKSTQDYVQGISTIEYNYVHIEVSPTITIDSIKLDVTATAGDGTPIKYMYSKNNGLSWEEFPSTETKHSYTFEELLSDTEYDIWVKVIDSNKKESNIYKGTLKTSKKITINFNPNGNEIETTSKSCIVTAQEESCTITTPKISKNEVTPDIIGYSLSATDHTKVVGSGEQLTVTRADDGKAYYAQTMHDSVNRTITFDPNGNTSFTYGNDGAQTQAKTYNLCTIEEKFNGATQSSSCSATITFPTIVAHNNTKTIIGWSNASGTHEGTYKAGQANVKLTAEANLTFYAQTSSTEKTYTATFIPQNAGSTLVPDLSGNNRLGKVYGNPKYSAEGLALDGEEDWVDAGLANQNFGKAFSTIVRFKIPTTPTNDSYIIGNAETAGMLIQVSASRKITGAVYNDAYQWINSQKVLELNTWYEVVLTFDGTNIRLYINGQLDTTKTLSAAANMKVSNMPFHIANNPNSNGFQQQLKETVSKASIYNKVLSQTDITNSYNDQTVSGALVSYDFTASRNKTASCKIDVTYNGKEQASGCEVTVPETTTREGYEYLGWNIDANSQTGSKDKVTIENSATNVYMITKKDITITYNANKATAVGRATDTCTLWNATDSCSKNAPSITAPTATPTVLGWNTEAALNSSIWSVNATRNLAETMTWYAQTRHDAVTRTVTFNPNGNTSFTYGSDTAQTQAKAYNLCTIASSYNGATQSSSCSATITFPTIVAHNNTKTIIGWSNASGTHEGTYKSGQTGVALTAASNLTFYAQTQSTEKTYTATFIPQNAGSTLVNDLSGNNHPGKVYGNPKYSTEGLALDGEEDWVDAGLANQNFGKAFSTIVRFKIPSVPTVGGYIIGNAEGAGMYITIGGARKVSFGVHNGSNYQSQTSGTVLNLDTWYELALTFDGTNIRLYINGKLDSTKTLSAAANMKQSVMPFHIGHNPDSNNTFTSQLKETVSKASIYNKVLSQTEITNSYSGQTISGALVSYDFTANRNKTASCKIDVTYNGKEQASGCEVTVPETTVREGYEYYGWSINKDAQTGSKDKVTIENSATNVYMITKKDITVTYNANKASGIGRATDTCTLWNATDSCSKQAPSITAPDATPTVLGWGTGPTLNYSIWSVNGARNLAETLTYYAQTTAPAITRTITYTKGTNVSNTGKGSDSCNIAATYNGATQSKTCNVTLPSITPASGYLVDGFYENGVRKGSVGASIAIGGNVTYTANVGTPSITLNSASASEMKVTASVSPASTPLKASAYQYNTADSWNGINATTSTTNTFKVEQTGNYNLYVRVTDAQGNSVVKSVSYKNPSIGTPTTSNAKWNSLDVSVTATKGTADIASYYFSSNDGKTFGSAVANTTTTGKTTLTGLDPSTAYKIKAYVVDKNGRKSANSATGTGTTASYTFTTVKINSSSVTKNSVSINYTGTNGTGTIQKYRIFVNGSQVAEVTNGAGTFNYTYSTGVTPATSYKVKVQAVDNNKDSQGNNMVSAYSNEITAVTQYQQNFAYTGDYQTFTAPGTGTYKIELWGARGGKSLHNNIILSNYAKGAYTKGEIYLTKGTVLYLYIGGAGSNGILKTNSPGGYNGGGSGTWDGSDDESGGGGGGATDVRITPGAWDEFESLKSRIMVAAGGGGEVWDYAVGAGGGLSSENIFSSNLYATQTSGYAFGKGMNGSGKGGLEGIGGGGGGYYGGRNQDVRYQSSGAGGSSYISGHTGCNSINQNSTSSSITHSGSANHYSGYKFTNTVMVDGDGYNWTTEKGSQTGMPDFRKDNTVNGNQYDGHARIIFMDTTGSKDPTFDDYYEAPEISIAASNTNSSSITITVTQTAGTADLTSYEYYLGSILKDTLSTNTYTFTGLSPNTSYTIGVIATDAKNTKTSRTEAKISTSWINTTHRLCVISGGANVYSDIGLSNKIGAINSGRIVTVTKVVEGVYNFVGYNGNAATSYQKHLNGYIRASALTSVTSGCRCMNTSGSSYGDSSTNCSHQ